jgi:hypothetical protein
MRVKRMEAEGTEKKVEIKKRLADFRQVRVISNLQFIVFALRVINNVFICVVLSNL